MRNMRIFFINIYNLFYSFFEKRKEYRQASRILGRDFISPEKIMKFRRSIIYTNEQLVHFIETVPVRKILELCRDNNCMLVAGPNCPMSLLEIRHLDDPFFHLREDVWDTHYMVETKWYMIRKDTVPGSTGKSWDESNMFVSNIEFVPNVSELFWAITTYKAVRGVCLFGGVYVRTSSVVNEDRHVFICFSDNHRSVINDIWDGDRSNRLGLSVARKS